MVETFSTATMTVSSILFFYYWFRYICRLILSAATSRDYGADVAIAHQLGFPEAQRQLNQGTAQLDALKDRLDRDYTVLVRLMNHTENSRAGIEQRILAIYYRLTALSYILCSKISSSAARKALEEMSMVVAHFANYIGEAANSRAAA
jgi:hypothetical protein